MSENAPEPPSIGVLVMAYGTPRTIDEVEPYYTDIRRGRPPSPEQLSDLIERYQFVGGTTPLLEISQAQADGLQAALGSEYSVFLGMKHWHPYIKEAVAEMQRAGIRQAVGVVLAPHYSRGSVGEYSERVTRAREGLEYDLDIPIVNSWHLNPHYLNAVESHIRRALAEKTWPESPPSFSRPTACHNELSPTAIRTRNNFLKPAGHWPPSSLCRLIAGLLAFKARAAHPTRGLDLTFSQP